MKKNEVVVAKLSEDGGAHSVNNEVEALCLGLGQLKTEASSCGCGDKGEKGSSAS